MVKQRYVYYEIQFPFSYFSPCRSFGDFVDDGTDPSTAFLDALRSKAMDEMHEAALEYGIVLKDLAVIDRQFKGMDRLAPNKWQ
jgi:hypothetical protein